MINNNITKSDRKRLLNEVEKNIISVPQDKLVDHSVGGIIILFDGRKNKELRLFMRDIIDLVGKKLDTTFSIEDEIRKEGYIEFRFKELVKLNHENVLRLLYWVNEFLTIKFIGYQGFRMVSPIENLYDHPLFRGHQNLG